ncbi:MAG: hypothetical protein COB02_17600 [Candidatus Cloacimonadota bacterium]|nr:MAG: hypothetical protein COB02_17600 [Candidatus Cloacimonadota bacterium]
MTSLNETKLDVLFRKLQDKKVILKQEFDEAYDKDDFRSSVAIMDSIQKLMLKLSSLEAIDKPFKSVCKTVEKIEDLKLAIEINFEDLGKEYKNLDGLKQIFDQDLNGELNVLLDLFRHEEGKTFEFEWEQFSKEELMTIIHYNKSNFPSRVEEYENYSIQISKESEEKKSENLNKDFNLDMALKVEEGTRLEAVCIFDVDQNEVEELEEVELKKEDFTDFDHGLDSLSDFEKQQHLPVLSDVETLSILNEIEDEKDESCLDIPFKDDEEQSIDSQIQPEIKETHTYADDNLETAVFESTIVENQNVKELLSNQKLMTLEDNISIESEETADGDEATYSDEVVYEDDAAYSDEVVYADDDAYSEEVAYEDEATYNEEIADGDDAAYSEEVIGGDDVAYSEEVVYEDDAAYSEEVVYEDDAAYSEEVVYEDDVAYSEEVVSEDDAAYSEEIVYEDDAAYSEEVVYEDDAAYGEEVVGEDGVAYSEEVVYEDGVAYSEEVVSEDGIAYSEEVVGEDDAAYSEEVVYEDGAAYSEEVVYEDDAAYSEEVVYEDDDDAYSEEVVYEDNIDEQKLKVDENKIKLDGPLSELEQDNEELQLEEVVTKPESNAEVSLDLDDEIELDLDEISIDLDDMDSEIDLDNTSSKPLDEEDALEQDLEEELNLDDIEINLDDDFDL